MSNKPYPSREKSLSLFEIDFGRGILIWKPRPDDPFMYRREGGEARFKCGKYLAVGIDGETFLAHRVIWIAAHGDCPFYAIDHIDGDTLNNSLSNLRPASRSENKQNGKIYANNSAGFKGVSWLKGRWTARITVNAVTIFLGQFRSKMEAAFTYDAAAFYFHKGFARVETFQNSHHLSMRKYAIFAENTSLKRDSPP